MRVLILIRHGSYGGSDVGFALTERGVDQMRWLTEHLQTTLVQPVKVVMSFDAPRIEDSANVIADTLNLEPPAVVSALDASSFARYEHNQSAIVAEIAAQGAGVCTLIVVGSLPMLARLPYDFGAAVLGVDFSQTSVDDADRVHPKGSAVVIDCVAKTCELIVPDG